MFYLIQNPERNNYALVSDSGQADGWEDHICDLSTDLRYKFSKLKSNTYPETFAHYNYPILVTFSDLSEFHSLPQTHPEVFL